MKKFLAIALVLVFALSLCACNDNGGGNGGNSGNSFVGTWKLIDVTGTQISMPEGAGGTIELKADNTFEMKFIEKSGDETYETVSTGTYSISGSDIELTAKSSKDIYNGQSSEISISTDEANVNGTITGNKLELSKNGQGITFIKE